MKTMTELRNELAKTYEALKAGETDTKTVAELSNVAGKMINTAKVQIEYNTLIKSGRKIRFLECD